MTKICVQRKVTVWIEDTYIVDEVTDESIEAAIDYDIDPDDSDVLWETQEDLGPIEVYDQHRNLIYSKKY